MPCSAAYLRTSSVIFIEQKCGPHMEQKCAVFAPSCGSVSSWNSRAVSDHRLRFTEGLPSAVVLGKCVLMALMPIELEALSSSVDILKGYDAATDQWRFPRDSDFWKAVYHAHDLGRRGQGQRIAIIDSGCELAIPRLARRI